MDSLDGKRNIAIITRQGVLGIIELQEIDFIVYIVTDSHTLIAKMFGVKIFGEQMFGGFFYQITENFGKNICSHTLSMV